MLLNLCRVVLIKPVDLFDTTNAVESLQGSFDHPYVSFLFYGMDTAGDFIPIKQLREKYNRPRHEVPSDDDGGGEA